MPLFRRKNKEKDASRNSNKNENIRGMSESQPLACDESESSLPEIDKETQKKAQDVMKDHLDIMRDVVMKIRHQDGYAKAMYANCPRLQHLLDRNPDLRPVFEDPRLVRINFETVYKEAGGILPEDEEEEERKRNNPSLILRIANHPIFKILKVLIFVKKIVACIAGGGIALVSSCWACCTDCCTDCCCEDAVEEIGEVDDPEDEYGIDTDAPLDENQKALNTAADYMEDPEVQEQMQRLLEDPENLEDAIENDAELRALRDSNPLCAELMQDPDTMKILTDPDNLRALGEAPQMIELDFSDPHGFSPEADFVDVEAGEFEGYDGSGEDFLEASGSMDGLEAYEADYDENEVYFPMEDDPNDLVELGYEDDGAAMGEEGFEDEMLEEDEELGAEEIEMSEVGGVEEEPVPAQQATTSGWEDNFEMEQQEIDVELEADADADAEAANKSKGKGKETKQRKATDAQKQGGMAGVVSSLGVAATDVIAASIVGEVFGADFLPGDLMGGGDMGPDLGGIDAAANQADAVVNDDVAGLAEDTADDIQDEREAQKDTTEEEKRRSRYSIDDSGRKNYIGLMGTTAAAAAAAAALGPMLEEDEEESSIDDGLESIGSKESDFRDEEDSEKASDIEESPEKPKSKVGGFFKNLASATVTAAKEHMAGALLGDDFAEMLIEKQENMGESDDEKGGDEKKKKKKRFGLFGRKKDEEEGGFNVDEELRESFQISATGNNDQSFYDSLPAYEFEANEDEDQYNPDFNASIPDHYSNSRFNMRMSTVSIPPGQVFEADEEDEEHDPNFYSSNPEYSMSIPERNSISSRRKSALSSSMPPDLVFEANEDEEEYDPSFYGSSNPDYTSSAFTFAPNEDEEEYDPNFYRNNPEYTASFRDDEDDTLEGSSSRRGYFG